MKRFFVLLLVLTVLFSFSLLPDGKEKEKSQLFKVPHDQPTITQKDNPEAAQEKRERHLRARARKQERHGMHSSLAGSEGLNKPQAVDMVLDSTYTFFQRDYADDCVVTGMCHNAGTSSAVYIEVHMNFYDAGMNLIGSDYSFVWGGTNSLTSGGYYTNALGPGDYGFFKIWTNYNYSDVYYWSYWFTWETYSHTPAMAQLDFDGDVYKGSGYSGDLEMSGNIKNSSASYVTYFTRTAFAVFGPWEYKVVDVDYAYVDGSTYNYGSGTTDTAVYPFESRPFEVNFPEATYAGTSNTFMYAFEWDEARASSLPEQNPPFGSFVTPIDNSTVSSSIPVTGWALDDTGVESVKIYRGPGNNRVYIGDALLVEGARPDVAAAFPDYPNNTRAGWGYMLLTNFLPNGGNGTFTLSAIATDGVGKTTVLGSKTIHCDNANAVKPFGAIDSPLQGGTASGSSYRNNGWVLTPLPDHIPTDGSTINVFVDSANLGHPNYNGYRSDIAGLFPGYQNSNGAAGFFEIDTTTFHDGVHTIFWTAADSGGDSDGIGSRYFTINNGSRSGTFVRSAVPGPYTPKPNFSQIAALPNDYSAPVKIKRGFKEDTLSQAVYPDETGMTRIVMEELQRVEIHLFDPVDGAPQSARAYSGNLVDRGQLKSLPIGSTFDSEKGIFYWCAAPGFLGRFDLVFFEIGPNGVENKKSVTIEIVPKKYLKQR